MITIAAIPLGASVARSSFGVNVTFSRPAMLVLNVGPWRSPNATLPPLPARSSAERAAPRPGPYTRLDFADQFNLWHALHQPDVIPTGPVVFDEQSWYACAFISTDIHHELNALEGKGLAEMSKFASAFARLLRTLAESVGASVVLVNCDHDLRALHSLLVASTDYFCLLAAPGARPAPLIPALASSIEEAVKLRTLARADGKDSALARPRFQYIGYVLASAIEQIEAGMPPWQLDLELRSLLKSQLRYSIESLDPMLLVPYATEIGDLRGADDVAASAHAVGRPLAHFEEALFTRERHLALGRYAGVTRELMRRTSPPVASFGSDAATSAEAGGTAGDQGQPADRCALRFRWAFEPGLLVEWAYGKEEIHALVQSPDGDYFPVYFQSFTQIQPEFAWLEVPSGRRLHFRCEPNLIVVEELSIECMTCAVQEAWRHGFFSSARPLSADAIPAQTWEWPMWARGDKPDCPEQ